MVAKVVLFSPQAMVWLKKEARRVGVGSSELVRRYVDEKRTKRGK